MNVELCSGKHARRKATFMLEHQLQRSLLRRDREHQHLTPDRYSCQRRSLPTSTKKKRKRHQKVTLRQLTDIKMLQLSHDRGNAVQRWCTLVMTVCCPILRWQRARIRLGKFADTTVISRTPTNTGPCVDGGCTASMCCSKCPPGTKALCTYLARIQQRFSAEVARGPGLQNPSRVRLIVRF